MTPLPKLENDKFIMAWLIAPLLSLSPWLVFFPILIAWQDILQGMFIVLYTGVVLFGIPTSLIYARRRIRSRLIFIIFGAVFGQLTPIISAVFAGLFPAEQFEAIKMVLGPAFLFGSVHGALCAYIYHRIVYDSPKNSP